MKPCCRAMLALSLLVLLAAAGRTADDKTPATEYFPVKVGNSWNYKMGDSHYTVKVAQTEDVGKQPCVRVETTANNKARAEDVAVKADGVYRFAVQSDTTDEKLAYDPPLCFLKLPVKKGDSWKVDSRVGGADTNTGKVVATFKTDEIPELKVGTKTYEKVVTVTSDDLVANGTKVAKVIYYYAKDVGLVKQVLTFNGQDVVTELESYEFSK